MQFFTFHYSIKERVILDLLVVVPREYYLGEMEEIERLAETCDRFFSFFFKQFCKVPSAQCKIVFHPGVLHHNASAGDIYRGKVQRFQKAQQWQSIFNFMSLCTADFACLQPTFIKSLPQRCYFLSVCVWAGGTTHFSLCNVVELYCQTPPETIP